MSDVPSYNADMATVSIRDLTRGASRVVEDVARSKRPAIVTRRGEPVAAVVPIDRDELEDFVLSHAPSFVRSLRRAEKDIATARSRSLADILEELDAKERDTERSGDDRA